MESLQNVDNISSRRIVAEHLRSSMMIICDGGRPSNIDRGYIHAYVINPDGSSSSVEIVVPVDSEAIIK